MTFLSEDHNHVGIIGAGPVGSLLSIYLAKQGIRSDLYERRSDIRSDNKISGRSINLAVSTRGLHALKEVGLEDHILKEAIPMKGRMIHLLHGNLKFQPYSTHNGDCIYSMSRGGLNKALLALAEESGLVKVHFQNKAIRLNIETSELTLWNENNGKLSQIIHPVYLATDGSSSVIRKEVMSLPGHSCAYSELDYGYKELLLPPGPQNTFLLDKNSLHIWPRGSYMLIALPNKDGSFTCTLFLSHEGETSLSSLKSRTKVSTFFQDNFPDIVSLIPNLPDQFLSNPIGRMGTVKCTPWNIKGRLLLLGDAAHGIVPFFGQGMNCGFEDCSILNQMFNSYQNWEEIFSRFSLHRKPDTDGIADMAIENFIEMRDKVRLPHFLLQKEVEGILEKSFLGTYISRYSLITFSRVPYLLAYKVGIIEQEILSELCNGLKSANDVNLVKAKFLIETKLKPFLELQRC